MTLPPVVRLKRSYDKHRLKSDLRTALQHYQPHPHIGNLHDGSWTGLSLRSTSGRVDDGFGLSLGRYQNTPVLEHCPYFREILDYFPGRVCLARLLFLGPGKRVAEHTDSTHHWETGILRLHIPIVTHKDVHFIIGDEEAAWKEGELWFGDFARPHSIHNASPVTRIHLVIDVAIDDELIDLFPHRMMDIIRRRTTIFRPEPAVSIPAASLEKFAGTFIVPAGVLPLPVPFPILGEVRPRDGMLQARIFGIPSGIWLTPVGPDRFTHLSHEIRFRPASDGDGWIAAMTFPDVYVTTRELPEYNLKSFESRILRQPGPVRGLYRVLQTIHLNLGFRSGLLLAGLKQNWNRVREWLPGHRHDAA